MVFSGTTGAKLLTVKVFKDMHMNRFIKQIAFFACMITGPFFTEAQVLLQPQLPSQGLVQQSQLWNVLAVNNGEPLQGCIIQLSFQEEGTGRKIFMATTGPLFLSSGVSQVTQQQIGAVQYDYVAPGGNAVTSGGLLPVGRFVACYSLLPNGSKTMQAASQVCVSLTVEPFAPPQLAYPADKSEISTDYPVFNWLPPMPADLFTDLRYKMVLTEVREGQSAADAIQRNPILFFRDGLKEVALAYPSSYVALQKGKTYAWQVVASNGQTYSAATEIWSFTRKDDSPAIVLDNASYPHLQRGAGSNHFVVHEKMKFSYENEAGDSLLTVKIYDYNDRGNAPLLSRQVAVQRGSNFIDFELGSSGRFQSGRDYVLEIVNGWKESWDLRFRYEPLNP
jgi:hypothetical protein